MPPGLIRRWIVVRAGKTQQNKSLQRNSDSTRCDCAPGSRDRSAASNCRRALPSFPIARSKASQGPTRAALPPPESDGLRAGTAGHLDGFDLNADFGEEPPPLDSSGAHWIGIPTKPKLRSRRSISGDISMGGIARRRTCALRLVDRFSAYYLAAMESYFTPGSSVSRAPGERMRRTALGAMAGAVVAPSLARAQQATEVPAIIQYGGSLLRTKRAESSEVFAAGSTGCSSRRAPSTREDSAMTAIDDGADMALTVATCYRR
jgi:hypothetical protein